MFPHVTFSIFMKHLNYNSELALQRLTLGE